MLGVLKGTALAPIDLINGDRSTTLAIGHSVTGSAEVLMGTDGQVTELTHSPVSRMMSSRAEVAKTADYRIGLGVKGFDLQVTGRAAMRGRFAYRNNPGEW